MAKFTEKISTLLKHQAPEFVLNDHPRFLEFVKQYYTFMESAKLSVTSIQSTDGIQLESETGLTDVLLLDSGNISSQNTQDDAGDKVILETFISVSPYTESIFTLNNISFNFFKTIYLCLFYLYEFHLEYLL